MRLLIKIKKIIDDLKLNKLNNVITMKVKTKEPKGLKALLDALKASHADAIPIADMIDNWFKTKNVPKDEFEKLENWLKPAKCDEGRKIARCIAKCIYNHCLECS